MALTKCNVPSNVIGSLATRAEERGLTTQEFKDKFDEMPEGIKQYINEVLTEEIDAHMAESASKHITASGSNDNGYYIRFDDGTQICMHTMVGSDFGLPTSAVGSTTVQGLTFYRATQTPWNFPAPFVDTNYVLQIHTKSGLDGIRLNWVNHTGSKLPNRVSGLQIVSLYDDFSGFESVDLVAIGRWK